MKVFLLSPATEIWLTGTEFFNVIKNSNYEGWIVIEAEQDPHIYDPLEYAQKTRAFIKEKLDI